MDRKDYMCESTIIKMLEREMSDRLTRIVELYGLKSELETSDNEGKADGTMVSPGLKLRRKSDNMLMTVDTIGREMIRLRTPDGELYDVMSAKLDDEFELD